MGTGSSQPARQGKGSLEDKPKNGHSCVNGHIRGHMAPDEFSKSQRLPVGFCLVLEIIFRVALDFQRQSRSPKDARVHTSITSSIIPISHHSNMSFQVPSPYRLGKDKPGHRSPCSRDLYPSQRDFSASRKTHTAKQRFSEGQPTGAWLQVGL